MNAGKQLSLKELQAHFQYDVTGGDVTNERISIYAEAFKNRLIESLSHDFPKTASCLGETAFYEMAVAYLAAFPSRFANIAEAGSLFPEFLKSVDHVDIPYLSELAQSEWLQTCCYLAENTPSLKSKEAAEHLLAPEKTIFRLRPSAILFSSEWSVHLKVEAIKKNKTRLLFYRNVALNVTLRVLSEDEHYLLSQLVSGKTVDEAFTEFSATSRPQEAPIAEWLREWFELQLLLV